MPLVHVTLAAGAFTEKQKHDLAAKLTDAMVAFGIVRNRSTIAWKRPSSVGREDTSRGRH